MRNFQEKSSRPFYGRVGLLPLGGQRLTSGSANTPPSPGSKYSPTLASASATLAASQFRAAFRSPSPGWRVSGSSQPNARSRTAREAEPEQR